MQGDGFLLLWVLFVGKMGGKDGRIYVYMYTSIQVCKYVSM
jgi:hypothetical protein